MIKLVITSDTTAPITHCFEHFPVIIGGKQSPAATLKLELLSLNDCHLQIVSQKSEGKTCYYLLNTANDPFSTLNGLPFGKQPLENNDLIQVHDVTIQFETEAIDTKDAIKPTSVSDETEKNLCPLKQNPHSSSAQPGSPIPAHQHKLSLKDYYLSEYDEDNQTHSVNENTAKNQLTKQFSNRLKFLLVIAASLVVLLCGSAAVAYFWVSDQSDGEEIKAARGVADVAMALAYAGLKNIQPQNQNLSYHEFLKNNLYAIIEPNSTPAAEFDSHGQFSNCPYMLRIHTNSDLSQCLIIAQPAPSLLQWLIPKASIVIDSLSMEMRKIKDIKALNRLIANTSNLEGSSGIEISHIVRQGSLIKLSSLSDDDEYAGFNPPQLLAEIRPGSENLVYNAPRYYLLGEAILETSLNMMDHFTAPGDVQMLQQELKALMQYPNLVLYSSEGIQNALESQKALAAIAPKDNFLIGYLKFTLSGKIASAELLIDHETTDVVLAEHIEKEIDAAYEEGFEGQFLPSSQSLNSKTEEHKEGETNKRIDKTDPLFLHLTSMTANRHHILRPITEEMIDLLKKELVAPQADFSSRVTKLQKKYLSTNKEELGKLEKTFESISNEYAHMPASIFMEYIKEANVEIAFQNYLKKESLNISSKQITDDNINEQIKKIEKSYSWPELESASAQTNQLLCFKNIPDYKRLISFQNTVRLTVTQKLNQFILSSDSTLSGKDFSIEYLQSLSNILKNSWIIDPETYNFYIDEFELREPQRL